MGILVSVFSVISVVILCSPCSLAVTEDGKFFLQAWIKFLSVCVPFSFFFPSERLSRHKWFSCFPHFPDHNNIYVCPIPGLTLLEIKSTLNDTKNLLSNWVASDESHCAWTGISCHPQDQRVRSM